MLTIQSTARRLQVSETCIRGLVATKAMPGRLEDGHWRIPPDALDAWLAGSVSAGAVHVSNTWFIRYMDQLVNGNRNACEQTVQQLLDAGVGLKDLYVSLFQRSLFALGEMWEQHLVSVGTEHLATAITERLMTLLYPVLFRQPHRDLSVVVCCVANELHQVGAKMVCDLFELHGWHAFFLGANTPVDGLLDLIDLKHPDMLGVSVSLSTHLPACQETCAAVGAAWPRLPILVGGQAFLHADTQAFLSHPNVRHVPTLDQLEAVMDGYQSHGHAIH